MANIPSSVPHPAPEAEESIAAGFIFWMKSSRAPLSGTPRRNSARPALSALPGPPTRGKLNLELTSELPGNVLSLSLAPENATLEAEYFSDADPEEFAKRKPLLWFWQMFDRSPIGTNHWLGIRFRGMLGRHIFGHMGMGVKIYHGVDLTYGLT